MKKLTLKQRFDVPMVSFDHEKGELIIEGRSVSEPENAKEFYKPLLSWLEEYSRNPRKKTRVRLLFYYYNTNSKKYITDILKKLDRLYKKGNDVKIQWQYNEGDYDSEEVGEEYNDVLSVPIEVVCV